MFSREPAVVLGSFAEVIRAVIPTLIIFGGIHWTSEQVAQFVLLVGVIVGALNVTLTRSQVVATPAVNDLIRTAVALPTGTTVAMVKAEQAEKDAKA